MLTVSGSLLSLSNVGKDGKLTFVSNFVGQPLFVCWLRYDLLADGRVDPGGRGIITLRGYYTLAWC